MIEKICALEFVDLDEEVVEVEVALNDLVVLEEDVRVVVEEDHLDLDLVVRDCLVDCVVVVEGLPEGALRPL